MRYYALISNQNIVENIIVGVEQDFIDGKSTADWYAGFTNLKCQEVFLDDPESGNYAQIGYFYDSTHGTFINAASN